MSFSFLNFISLQGKYQSYSGVDRKMRERERESDFSIAGRRRAFFHFLGLPSGEYK